MTPTGEVSIMLIPEDVSPIWMTRDTKGIDRCFGLNVELLG